MKKLHFVLLIITAVMALFSAYALAAMNQVYKIDFEWYSQYSNTYLGEYRDTSTDKWALDDYPENLQLKVLGNTAADAFQNAYVREFNRALDGKSNAYIYMYCSLGTADSPEYRIKVTDIAQRGNVVEVKLSMNSPLKPEENGEAKLEKTVNPQAYYPIDVIRIKKDAFPVKDKLYFIFKNQNGSQIGEQYCDIF